MCPKPLFVQLLLLKKQKCENALPACIYVHHVHAGPLRGQKGLRFPGTKVTDSCELLCGHAALLNLNKYSFSHLVSSPRHRIFSESDC